MNLSRRAKLDREAPARGAARNAKPGEPAATPPAAPEPPVVAEVVAPPAPEAPVETPKLPRFVRPPAEKRAAAKPAGLPQRSTSSSGKMMSKNMGAARPGTAAAGVRKGPPVGREPIVNTPKRA